MNAVSIFEARGLAGAVLVVLVSLALGACGKKPVTGSAVSALARDGGLELSSAPEGSDVQSQSVAPPSGLATVVDGGESLTLWPYTGTSFDGTGSDPVNLIFAGEADPVAVRDALLSLDGNRTALGFPPVPPFDARWSDCVGDAQTSYAEGDGWTGSAIQLQLGSYAPLRVHLRLFRVGKPYGAGGTGAWTVGAAHFEVLIPGTADHQVLSWELAEQIVAADLARSGLLDPANPVSSTAALNSAPSFREIPGFIYNALPAELTGLVGGPAQPAAGGVPISNDGRATVLHLAKRAPRAGARHESFTIHYDQVVPRPLCSAGPTDWIRVRGPVEFEKTAGVDDSGRYFFDATYSGRLVATPVDITVDPPALAGEPFEALVTERQQGETGPRGSRVHAFTRRLVPGNGGSEFVFTRLDVGTIGGNRFELQTRCQ
jgi:hypothetical protein